MSSEQSSIWPTFLKYWKYYHCPGKPSRDDLHIVERWLKKLKVRRVLILGSTPQLRDLCAKLKLETTVMDMQIEMLQGMQRYMVRKNVPETIIRSDWLTAPLREGYFDAVLGDLIMENVPHAYKIPLLKNISRWLRPGGHFITKVFFVPEGYGKLDPLPVINYIARLPRNENRSSELFVHLYFYGYDKKKKTLFTSTVTKLIRRYYKNGKTLRGIDTRAAPLFRKILLLWGNPMSKKWYLGSRAYNLREISRVFRIQSYEEPGDYLFAQCFPTIICGKRTRSPKGKR